MVAFSPSDIPSNVTTLEQLISWGCTVLQHLEPELTAVEAAGVAERVVSAAPFFITATDQYEWRYIVRASIPVSPNWQKTGKIYAQALPVSSQTIPAEFKAA